MSAISTIKAVIFDLDGTLIDTLTDLKNSLNHVLESEGLPPRSLDEVRRFVGNGLKKLVERGLPENTEAEILDRCTDEMLSYYKANSMIETKPYPGVCQLIAALSERGIKTAVVTNKAQAAAEGICNNFFENSFQAVLGDNQKAQLKPHPQRIFEALELLGVSPEEAVYIGDSEVDALTSENAGLLFLGVLWGFRDRDVLEKAGAKILFSDWQELRDHILKSE